MKVQLSTGNFNVLHPNFSNQNQQDIFRVHRTPMDNLGGGYLLKRSNLDSLGSGYLLKRNSNTNDNNPHGTAMDSLGGGYLL